MRRRGEVSRMPWNIPQIRQVHGVNARRAERTSMSPIAEAITLAAPSFTGQLLQAGDDGYDERRRVHNGSIDRRPAAIAACDGVADIVAAVKLARALGLEVSVRGGGHNVAGRATIDGGLMIDLSPMKGIRVNA